MKKRPRIHRPERDRAIFTVLRLVRGKTDAEVAGKSGVSPQTIRKWRLTTDAGGTRFPQFFTMDRVLRAHGYCFQPQQLPERNADAKSEHKSTTAH